jgi:RHS repeat-associated protein
MLNFANVPQHQHNRWDYRDMIHTLDLEGGGTAYYQYDAGKQRTRKRIVKGSIVEERIYLSGYELYRRTQAGEVLEEIETNHLFADDQRVLMVEDVLSTNNTNLRTGLLYRYQYGNHLGSVALECDADAAIISYEEYHPYGTTAYQARNINVKATAKRYRYTGMERDEESGLAYHTARYYLPWLGRWGSCDPIGVEGGGNLYGYSYCNPLLFIDLLGNQPTPPPPSVRPKFDRFLGKKAHADILPEVARRINKSILLGGYYVAEYETPTSSTALGGSAKKGSKSKGRIDLTIFSAGRPLQIYDLKPLGTSGYYDDQIYNYVLKAEHFGATAKGTILEELVAQDPSIFAPIDVRISPNKTRRYFLSLPPVISSDGQVLPGFFEYTYVDIKNDDEEQSEEESRPSIEDRNYIINPFGDLQTEVKSRGMTVQKKMTMI